MDVDEGYSSFQTPSEATPVETPKEEEEFIDEVSALFFGKETEIKTFTNQEGKQETHQKESKFFNQLLNVQDQRDIYAAWEQEHRGTIDDYEHTVGQPRV